MESEIFKTIMKWLEEPIMDSTNLKFVRTCIENEEPIIYASIKFSFNSNGCNCIVEEERRISLKDISPQELFNKLDVIINCVNINEICSRYSNTNNK